MTYYSKKPIRSFQDLQVYQLSYNLAVKIIKTMVPNQKIGKGSEPGDPSITPVKGDTLTGDLANGQVGTTKSEGVTLLGIDLENTLLSIPRLIATAHSLRFGDPQKGIEILEQTMLNCNLAVHYLSLYRDLSKQGDTLTGDLAKGQVGTTKSEGVTLLDIEDIESYTKQYLQLRTKILRLQMSWKKFAKDYAKK